MQKDRAAAAAVTMKGGLTPEQQAHDRRLGGMVPTTMEERERMIKEGTIAYFFTFANGFTMFYTDSAGPTTDAERTIMRGRPKVDVGLIPYYGGELAPPITMEYIRLFKPDAMLPTHHDVRLNCFERAAHFTTEADPPQPAPGAEPPRKITASSSTADSAVVWVAGQGTPSAAGGQDSLQRLCLGICRSVGPCHCVSNDPIPA